MKRFLTLIFFAIVGFVSGIAVGAFNTGLIPLCGDPCSTRRLGSSAIWGLALMVAFPVIAGVALKKTGRGIVSTFAVAVVLSLAVLLPAAAIYGYELHQFYRKSPAILGVPDVDYSYMVIATKPVTASYENSAVRINAWERCALGPVSCDKKPRTVEAMCLGIRKSVLIKEADWPAFQRIPEEDLQGLLERPKDMDFCSAN
jgi:MFS family permease